VFEPWWVRLWREHQIAIVGAGVPFGLFALYVGGFLLVLLFAPGRLARVGSAPLEVIPAPTGNVAFAWALLRKLWETVLLVRLCRTPRVRRAWVCEYSAGRSKLGDLGKFAETAEQRETFKQMLLRLLDDPQIQQKIGTFLRRSGLA
jgi:hypothetical protein